MESLEGKLNKLNSAWQSFATNTVNSDFVKGLLDIATSFLKMADAAGGLVPVLTTLAGVFALLKAGSLAKGVAELVDKFKSFQANVTGLGGGLKGFQLALGGVESGSELASKSITGLAGVVGKLSTALGAIGIVIGIGTSIYNSYIEAQRQANEEAIESSQKAAEEIKTKKENIKTTENEIQKLTEERDALLEVSDAGGENSKASKNLALDKQEEIEKRQMNIEKMQKENKELLKQREASARSMTFNKADKSGLGNAGFMFGLQSSEKEFEKFRGYVEDSNKALKEAGENTIAYNKKLEDLRSKYEKIAQEREKNGEKATAETDIIKRLNKEIENNKKKYEEDAKKAEELYDILLHQGNLEEEKEKWLKKAYDLTDEEIQKISEGIDIRATDAEKTREQEEAQNKLNEALSNAQSASNTYQSILDDTINSMVNYEENLNLLQQAQDMYNKSGYITADMYQQLQNAGLLQYLSEVDGKLVANTQAFDDDSNALKQNAENALRNKYAQDLLALAIEIQNGNLNSLNQSVDDTTTKSNQVNTTKAVNQLLNIGTAAGSATAQVQGLLRSLDGEKMTGVDMEKWTKEQQNAFNKGKAVLDQQLQGALAGLSKISLGSNKSSRGSGGGGKGKKSGSSKSAKEEYKAEVDALYWYKNALDNAEESVDKLNDALKNTDNFNEQEKYIRQLIDATNNQINKTNDLKNAQVGQINDFINQLRQQGFAIDYNASQNELYINNMQHLSDLTGDAAKNAEKLLDKIQDLNDDNRDLDGSIRDLTADVKDYYEQLEDIPEKKLEKFNDLMEEFQQSYLDQVQYQIEDLEHAMENDPRLKALNEQIEALEKQNDEVDKQKEMEEKLLAVEEAKLKLENARNQKTMQVYREGQGFVWEADFDAIKDAEEELKDAQDDLNQQIRDDQLEQLEAEKEAIENSYQDRIDALQNFLDEQEYLIDKANREGVQSFEELRNELKKYGLDSAEYLGKATDWLNNYNNALGSLNTTVQDILASSGNATSELVYSSAMQDRINQALSGMVPNVQQNPNAFGRSVSYDRITNDNQSVYINSIELPNVHNTDEFIKELKNLPRMAASNAALRK